MCLKRWMSKCVFTYPLHILQIYCFFPNEHHAVYCLNSVRTDSSAVSYSPFPVSTVWNDSCILTSGQWKRILQREIQTARLCMSRAMAPWDEWWWFFIFLWSCFRKSGSAHPQPPIRMLVGQKSTVRIAGKWPLAPFQVLCSWTDNMRERLCSS